MKTTEEERVRQAYERRKSGKGAGDVYTWFNRATAYHLQRQEQEVLRLLKDHNVTSLSDMEILEVGCGGGSELRNFLKYGAEPERIHGVDILNERIEHCRLLNPNLDLRTLNAESLPFDDGSFDIVCQFVMFTSILDSSVKRHASSEMLRVLRDDGLIIWYDYIISRPGNRDVKGIGRKEIASLFPGCRLDFRRISLAAPISRAVAPRSWMAAHLLEKIPFLRSHYLVGIEKV